MTKEYVSAIFTSDEWISKDRMRLRANCNEDWTYQEPILRDILEEHRLDEDEIDEALKEIYENNQYRGDGFSVYVESFALNELE